MKIVTMLLLVFMIVTQRHDTNRQDWRQIVPLQSTRADVERLLGSTKEVYFAIYKLKEGSLFIEYSSGPCRPGRKGGWNVPENVVVSVSFSPKHGKRISSLKLDPNKFRKVIDQHVGGIVYYINDDEGIMYQVQSGKVDTIEYGPAKKHEHLYCGDTADQKVPPQ
ncbi:MAG TPA: hypothetical protein VFS90_24610 [Pyrinomonadaceae bacterium]|nr:hypothetical protein [Pyrinomonadaceae bacterium]